MVHELVRNFVEERIQFLSVIERIDTSQVFAPDIAKFREPLKILRAIKSEIDTLGAISNDNTGWLINFVGQCLSLNKQQQEITESFFPEKPIDLERHREMKVRWINEEQMLKEVINHI